MSFILSMLSICSDSVIEVLMMGFWMPSPAVFCLYIVILITKSYYRPTLIIGHLSLHYIIILAGPLLMVLTKVNQLHLAHLSPCSNDNKEGSVSYIN